MEASLLVNRFAQMPHPTVSVVAAVLVDDLSTPTRLLGARRSYPPALAGRFEFPGGKIEPGEEAQAALRRELREEIGVEVTLGSMIAGPEPGRGWRTSPEHVLRVWWAVASTTPQVGGSHDALAWVGPNEATALPWLDGNVPIVEAAVAAMRAAARTPADGSRPGEG